MLKHPMVTEARAPMLQRRGEAERNEWLGMMGHAKLDDGWDTLRESYDDVAWSISTIVSLRLSFFGPGLPFSANSGAPRS